MAQSGIKRLRQSSLIQLYYAKAPGEFWGEFMGRWEIAGQSKWEPTPDEIRGLLNAMRADPVFSGRVMQVRLLEYLIKNREELLRHRAPELIQRFYQEDASQRIGGVAPQKDLKWTLHPGKKLSQDFRKSLNEFNRSVAGASHPFQIELPQAGKGSPYVPFFTRRSTDEPEPSPVPARMPEGFRTPDSYRAGPRGAARARAWYQETSIPDSIKDRRPAPSNHHGGMGKMAVRRNARAQSRER